MTILSPLFTYIAPDCSLVDPIWDLNGSEFEVYIQVARGDMFIVNSFTPDGDMLTHHIAKDFHTAAAEALVVEGRLRYGFDAVHTF